MALLRLAISDFRNLSSVNLEPILNGFNLLYGSNGSGKTSCLEAIYYLSMGRSFRTLDASHIIRKDMPKLAVFGCVYTPTARQIPIGIERQQNGTATFRLGGQDVRSIVEIADIAPLQLINSNSFNLLDAGPAHRRRFLDWGIFYTNTEFLRVWRKFKRALKQRNAALRTHIPTPELDLWSHELAESAVVLDQLRHDYVARVTPGLQRILGELIPLADLEITYQPGWHGETAYAEVLAGSLSRDMRMGYTQYGPHKADLAITLGKVPVKDVLSRGQQKLFVCAMLLAQGAVLHHEMNKKPMYLIDDLPAELDIANRTSLIEMLAKQGAQVFVTTVEHDALGESLNGKPVKMFHVEHGEVREIF